jgi:hypothetical protein
MYSRSIISAVFLAIMPLTAVAQSHHTVKDNTESDPPSIQIVLSGTRTKGDAVITQLLDAPVEMPLGPIDVLKGYESAMSAIADTTVVVLTGISQAVIQGQLTREEAEYLTQERYEVSMMQYQVLSTLHAGLEHDIAQAALKRPHKQDAPGTAGAVETSSVRPAR